jgi:hypothetical protein
MGLGCEVRLITFEQARTIVYEKLASEFSAEDDFVVAPTGGETSSVYVVSAGPRAQILEPRTAPRRFNDEIITVNKVTGEIVYVTEPVRGATPCGSGP